MKEADSKAGKGRHPRAKLAHKHWTGSWQVTAVEQPALTYQASLRCRRIRGRTVPAANIKIFHERPERFRHDFEDEFARLAWAADLGLAGTSAVAAPFYTCLLYTSPSPRD